jgi:hypothetical protein
MIRIILNSITTTDIIKQKVPLSIESIPNIIIETTTILSKLSKKLIENYDDDDDDDDDDRNNVYYDKMIPSALELTSISILSPTIRISFLL